MHVPCVLLLALAAIAVADGTNEELRAAFGEMHADYEVGRWFVMNVNEGKVYGWRKAVNPAGAFVLVSGQCGLTKHIMRSSILRIDVSGPTSHSIKFKIFTNVPMADDGGVVEFTVYRNSPFTPTELTACAYQFGAIDNDAFAFGSFPSQELERTHAAPPRN